ncbi:MAG: hypothetical protein AMXMBFR4_27070 [Candidatus Hydrogenedentota bacterium]
MTVSIALAYLAMTRNWTPLIWSASVVAVTLALWFGFCQWYYHDWLPNTYRAKVEVSLPYRLDWAVLTLRRVLIDSAILLPLAAVLGDLLFGTSIWLSRSQRNNPPSFASVLGVGLFAYWLWVGGDVFLDRMLIVLWPLGAWILLSRLHELGTEQTTPWRMSVRHAVICATVIFPLGYTYLAFSAYLSGQISYSKAMVDNLFRPLVYIVERACKEDDFIAVDGAGFVPYLSDVNTLDGLGLNDRYIASLPGSKDRLYGHNKIDPAYLMGKKPALVLTALSLHADRLNEIQHDTAIELFIGGTLSDWKDGGYQLKYFWVGHQFFDVTGRPTSVLLTLYPHYIPDKFNFLWSQGVLSLD